MYAAHSHGMLVQAFPQFIPEHSNPAHRLYYFSYRIRITNQNSTTVRLLSREWIIQDGNGLKRKVSGEGVVGLQPEIHPGESFEYESFCPLPTPTGNMRGSYFFVRASEKTPGQEESFECEIPLFFLRDVRSFANSKAFVI